MNKEQMSNKLYVTAKFTAKNGCVDDMISLLEKLASETRSETGCLDYNYYQSLEKPESFTSIEIWETPEAETAHWNTEHIKEALAQLPKLMDGDAEVTKYHKVV